MDLFAAEIGMDRAEVRKRNVIAPDKFPYTNPGGAPYDSGEYAKAIDTVLEAADYAGLRAEQEAAASAATATSSGSGCPASWRSPAGGRPRRTPPSRCTPTAR
jgi:carbon-monoxide dehydrogenase large subunit